MKGPFFAPLFMFLFSLTSAALAPGERSLKRLRTSHAHGSHCKRAPVEPCAFEKNGNYSYEQVANCLRSVELPASVKASTLISLERTMSLYVFKDLHKSPPENGQIDTKVDIDAELAMLGRTEFPSAWAFYDAVSNIFTRLHDDHVTFTKPSCFHLAMHTPLVFGSRLNSNGFQEIYVADVNPVVLPPGIPESEWRLWIGARVDEIDGVPALQAISDWARANIAFSKDPGTTFNKALGPPSQNLFAVRYTSAFPLPPASMSVSGSIGDQTFAGVFPFVPRFSADHNMTAESCFSAEALSKKRSFDALYQGEPLHERTLREWMGEEAWKKQRQNTGGNIQVHTVDDVIVIRVKAFGFSNADRSELQRGLALARENNLTVNN